MMFLVDVILLADRVVSLSPAVSSNSGMCKVRLGL